MRRTCPFQWLRNHVSQMSIDQRSSTMKAQVKNCWRNVTRRWIINMRLPFFTYNVVTGQVFSKNCRQQIARGNEPWTRANCVAEKWRESRVVWGDKFTDKVRNWSHQKAFKSRITWITAETRKRLWTARRFWSRHATRCKIISFHVPDCPSFLVLFKNKLYKNKFYTWSKQRKPPISS